MRESAPKRSCRNVGELGVGLILDWAASALLCHPEESDLGVAQRVNPTRRLTGRDGGGDLVRVIANKHLVLAVLLAERGEEIHDVEVECTDGRVVPPWWCRL